MSPKPSMILRYLSVDQAVMEKIKIDLNKFVPVYTSMATLTLEAIASRRKGCLYIKQIYVGLYDTWKSVVENHCTQKYI